MPGAVSLQLRDERRRILERTLLPELVVDGRRPDEAPVRDDSVPPDLESRFCGPLSFCTDFDSRHRCHTRDYLAHLAAAMPGAVYSMAGCGDRRSSCSNTDSMIRVVRRISRCEIGGGVPSVIELYSDSIRNFIPDFMWKSRAR